MSQKNLISFNIPEADLAEIKACVDKFKEKLMPHLVKLTPEERQELLKMGDRPSPSSKNHWNTAKATNLTPEFCFASYSLDLKPL